MPYHRMSNKNNIVLLHGWGFDSIIMQQLAKNLSTQFVVTVLDLPGYGNNHQQYFPDSIQALAYSVKDLIPECAIVIGWSLGGLLALQLALLRKDITKIIVIAGSPCFTSRPGWPGMVAEKFNYFFEQLLTDKKAALNLFIHLNTKDNGQNKCLKQMVNDDVENKTL
ncbi:MAG: alpha/beta fold hydrolase, partial [Gammaproteobacteria bacterium]